MRTVLTFVFAVVATTVFGQAPDGGDPFKNFDKNGDGKVTADEVPNPQVFERLDKNKDGAITRDELGGAGKPGAGRPGAGQGGAQFDALVKAADKDGDGKITKAEAGDAAWFEKLDQNKDGVIDEGELKKAREAMGAGVAGGSQFEALLKRADKNGDGKVTKEEAGDAQWFEKLDQNKDGVIDATEIERLRKAAGGAGKPGAGKPGAGTGGGQFDALVKSADKNGDGEVTKEEAGNAPWFDKVDRNADGVLDAGELDALRKAVSNRGVNS